MTAAPGVGEGGQEDEGESGSDLGSSLTGNDEQVDRRRLHALAGMAG